MSKGLVDTNYLRMKAQLAHNHEYSSEFKKTQKEITVRQDNMLLLNKIRDISAGKRSLYS